MPAGMPVNIILDPQDTIDEHWNLAGLTKNGKPASVMFFTYTNGGNLDVGQCVGVTNAQSNQTKLFVQLVNWATNVSPSAVLSPGQTLFIFTYSSAGGAVNAGFSSNPCPSDTMPLVPLVPSGSSLFLGGRDSSCRGNNNFIALLILAGIIVLIVLAAICYKK